MSRRRRLLWPLCVGGLAWLCLAWGEESVELVPPSPSDGLKDQAVSEKAETPVPEPEETSPAAPPPVDVANDPTETAAESTKTEAKPDEDPVQSPVARLASPSFPEEDLSTDVDVVREFHDNGALKIERTVVRNSAGDWVSHGPWRTFDADGQVVGSGRYSHGKRSGHWTRVLTLEELALNTKAIAEGFTGPFTTEANYQDDRPHGTWRLSDSHCAIVLEVNLSEGLRHGRTVYYRPNGVKRSDARYVTGQLHGPLVKLSPDAKTADEKHLVWGRVPQRIERRDPQGNLRGEESWLSREVAILEGDDPWLGRLATFGERSDRLRHGVWIGYDDNGRVAWRCEYVLGQLHGPATWNYPDGQIKIEGLYALGRPAGRWKWRHPNGMPSATGDYTDGQATGSWLAWKDDGRQIGRKDLGVAAALTQSPIETRDARLETPQLPDGATHLK